MLQGGVEGQVVASPVLVAHQRGSNTQDLITEGLELAALLQLNQQVLHS